MYMSDIENEDEQTPAQKRAKDERVPLKGASFKMRSLKNIAAISGE